ncbi:hypothetical protein RUA8715_01241 [Ruegeria arenilitoris]|uniref:Uncharacterized protein n=1 Tax=Ruegeria arenilitoris TaxID=1173585 RepID=A0A238JZB2_9RHOB|nr:hypothetical protein RUA8715_01241 [Ruegeria arenilitoris]
MPRPGRNASQFVGCTFVHRCVWRLIDGDSSDMPVSVTPGPPRGPGFSLRTRRNRPFERREIGLRLFPAQPSPVSSFPDLSTSSSSRISTFYPRLIFMLQCYFLAGCKGECQGSVIAKVHHDPRRDAKVRGSWHRWQILGFSSGCKGLPVGDQSGGAQARLERSASQTARAGGRAPSGALRQRGPLGG